ncbi:MAG: acylphosphatase [Methanosarcinales archaeon]|nr:acylphosphatase [Methanosarcinales archaeon]
MMKKVTLYISGNVQRVGYRAKVISIATTLGIKGSIQNIPDGRVKIIAQGEQPELDKLIQDINISNSLINVTNITQEYSTPSDDYEGFFKIVSGGETDERLDNALYLFKKLITTTENGFRDLGDKVDDSRIAITSEIHSLGKELGDKIDRVGDKVDQVGDKVDQVSEKVDQSRIETTSEIHSLGDNLNSLFDTRITKIEFELAEIKDKVMVMESSSSYNLKNKNK